MISQVPRWKKRTRADRRQHVQAGGVNWQLRSPKAPSGIKRPEVEVAHPELGQLS